MNHLLALISAIAGLAAFCGAMSRHQHELLGLTFGRFYFVMLRVAGAALLLLSLWLAVSGHGPAIGFVVWVGDLAVGGAAIVLALVWRNRRAQ